MPCLAAALSTSRRACAAGGGEASSLAIYAAAGTGLAVAAAVAAGPQAFVALWSTVKLSVPGNPSVQPRSKRTSPGGFGDRPTSNSNRTVWPGATVAVCDWFVKVISVAVTSIEKADRLVKTAFRWQPRSPEGSRGLGDVSWRVGTIRAGRPLRAVSSERNERVWIVSEQEKT